MPHIHRLYDLVVSAFIVHRKRVLLAYHKKYREWLPVGGHVDLDEDPEEALFKEIREESGLKVKILAERPAIAHRGVKPIYTPSYVDVHRIRGVHKHIALIYFATARSGRVKLHAREHAAYRWVPKAQLGDPKLGLTKSIRFYCRKALAAAGVLALFVPAPLWAEPPAWRAAEISGQAETYELVSGSWRPLTPETRLQAGSKIRTGPESSVDVAEEAQSGQRLRVGPDSVVAFLNDDPARIALDAGSLLVLKEEEDPGQLRILTRDFLVSLSQGGCKLEASGAKVTLEVFSESANLQPKIEGGYAEAPVAVEEGFRYSSEGRTRMTYPEYQEWQAWYKKVGHAL